MTDAADVKPDHSVRELGRARLTLREDLIFTPQQFGDETCYTIEDPANSKFFRVGLAEYTFISLLDGRTSVSDALALTARARPDSAFTEPEAAAICKWLIESNLAATAESVLPARLTDAADKNDRAQTLARWNPAVIKLPLFHPDRFFDRLTPWVTWGYSWPALVAWTIAVFTAGYQVFARCQEFLASAQNIFARDNWLWLGVAWIVLKTLHELSHGIVCKRHGGAVREAGAMLILLAPVAYVDVTSSWRSRSHWPRIHTALAGIYIELAVAAIAAFVWSRTAAGLVHLVAFNIVVMASFTTVLFNANPLMKYDGYYVLSDLLGIPNLYSAGQQFLMGLARRWLLGLDAAPLAGSALKRTSIKLYGVASLVWRIVFSVGMALAAASYFHGAGIVLSCAAGAMWLGVPVFRLVRYLARGDDTERPNRTRFFAITGIGASSAAVLLTTVPWPGATLAPAVVEYAPLAVVRTGSPGFVREIRVAPGQLVREGDVLAVLDNPQLTQELADLMLEIEQSRIKLRALEKKNQLASQQAEAEKLESLEKKRAEKETQVDQLTLRAPAAGRVIGRNLASQLGRYFKPGAEFASIGDEERKEIRASISQDDLAGFSTGLDQPVRVRLRGESAFRATLARINPGASIDLPHPSLGASCHGPLVVRAKKPIADAKADDADTFELVEPRFAGIVSLASPASQSLRAGQTGIVWLRPQHESIASHLYHSAARWVRGKLHSKPRGA